MALAAVEPDAMVRGQLASSCQRWNAGDALPILSQLVRRDDDEHDPHIPNVIWWAFERQLRNDRDAVIGLLAQPDVQRAAAGHGRRVLERVARALASDGSDADFEACARLLSAAPGDVQVRANPERPRRGLEGRRLEHVPPVWPRLSGSGMRAAASRASCSLAWPHASAVGER